MASPFTQAPDEVLRYFDAKGAVPSFDWRDVAPEEHATMFTVAKTAGYDVLDDLRDATRKAIAEYRDYGSFVEDLEPLLKRKGWWGRQVVTDPLTGNTTIGQLGSLRRLRTIYWANVSTARASGEWERIQRTKAGLPFLLYEISIAERKRPEHLGWVGVVLPVDHPWWQTHYPPNGWLCRCRVRQISRQEAISLGYSATDDAPQVVYRSWKNKRTGESLSVPKGIDPGWQTNPGLTRQRNVRTFLTERLDALPENARRVAVRDIVGQKVFRTLARAEIPYNGAADRTLANIERGRVSLPVGMLSEERAKLLNVETRTVVLSNADAHKQMGKRADVTPEQYAMLQEMIERGQLYEDATSSKEFVLQAVIDGKPWTAILHVTRDRKEIYLKSLRRIRESKLGPSDRNIPMD